jgi:Flp pilus assembly protein TadG
MLLKSLRRFLKRENGNVAIIVAIAMMPMAVSAGVAIDFVRAHLAKTSLQQAIDAAGLASGSDTDTNADQVKVMAQSFLDANAQGLTLIKEKTKIDAKEVGGIKQVNIKATAELNTTFLRLASIEKLQVSIDADIQRKEAGPLQVALVLDVTASMGDVPQSGGTEKKIDSLRNAATALASELMSPDAPNTKVAVVPYAGYVRLYTSSEARDLVASGKVPGWITSITRKDCTRQKSCPAIIPPNTVPVCTGDGGFQISGDSCCSWPCVVGGPSVDQAFAGCVGIRAEGVNRLGLDRLDRHINDLAANPFPGLYPVSNCPSNKAVELTADEKVVTDTTKSLATIGQTLIPSGLTMGWAMLASGELFGAESVESVKAKGGRKVLVLMTDGVNSLGRIATNPEVYTHNRSVGDSITADLCINIKKAGIEIFTVAFDVRDTTSEQLLRNCASSDEMYFAPTDSVGLRTAFGEIGNQLRTVKLTQ